MNVLTVFAHPGKQSFCHSVLQRFNAGLRDAGHARLLMCEFGMRYPGIKKVDQVFLHAVRGANERRGWSSRQPQAPPPARTLGVWALLWIFLGHAETALPRALLGSCPYVTRPRLSPLGTRDFWTRDGVLGTDIGLGLPLVREIVRATAATYVRDGDGHWLLVALELPAA